MAKKLVIVESPAKAKTINKILGKDYVVCSCMGHVRDLPVRRFGVDIKNGFNPSYVMVKGRKKIIDDLIRETKSADAVYLAPDPDREGEAIAWHLKMILAEACSSVRFFRVSYNEITPHAVREAFKHPVELDMNRVWAQQARRIVDRIVGYRVSPLLWRRVRRGSSAGRVQSVALRLVCEREKQIKEFIPEAYWVLGALVRKLLAPLNPFKVMLARIDGEKAEIKTEEQSKSILGELQTRKLRVSGVTTREVLRKPSPPFITSTLQQAASGSFGLSPSRTMRIAQTLYEGIEVDGDTTGLITYMRTDSVALSQDALKECRKFISSQFSKAFLPDKPNFYKSRKGAQEAHEAIRPTDVTRTPEKLSRLLSPADLKLYRMIWQRFVASQMTPAKIKQRTVEVEAVPVPAGEKSYMFKATSSTIEFDGFMKVAGRPKAKKDGEEEAVPVPPLSEGEALQQLEWLNDRKETQPPNRYSEASLIRELEQNGVGRPSTYAQILATLSQRRYVTREKRALTPTELGMNVNDFLSKDLGELFDVGFTATMEQSLDEIEEGKKQWKTMVEDFYDRFAGWMEKAKGPAAAKEKVSWILTQFEGIKEWAPKIKCGRRTYDDEKFVESIRAQLTEEAKPVSERQLSVLLTLACRYESQLPGIDRRIAEAGLDGLVDRMQLRAPDEKTIRKLQVLRDVEWARGGRNSSHFFFFSLVIELWFR